LRDRRRTEALGAVPFKGKSAAIEVFGLAAGQPAG